MKKPPFPRFKVRRESAGKKFNPREQVDIHNPFPAHLWPVREGAACFFIEGFDIFSGRVAWFHPARKRDHCCVITPGCPFYQVKIATLYPSGERQQRSASHVFPYTPKGWKAALECLHKLHVVQAAKCRAAAEGYTVRAGQFDFAAKVIRRDISRL